jgi:predicted Zn-ribbon and HTH transcriptional regulator
MAQPMNTRERAKQIARFLQDILQDEAAPPLAGAHRPAGMTGVGELSRINFTVTRRGGCISCDPGSCAECGYLFTGESIMIDHKLRGKITLSDRAIHYLSHGMTHYQTAYVVRGEPVVVDLDLEDLAGYLDL